ncbi:MAG: SDR family NAD(P)-dependent oxidoreductase [Gammaproteobacteria bacterium]|nr:SDR family NAD(P)-dependent oxidoreductase [Gammaproteobacteria bacterium]
MADTTSKTVLITGCSSGIGECLATAIHYRAGYRVLATARQQPDVDRLRGEGLDALQLDLADSGSIAAAVDESLARSDGRIDILINNGAYGQPGAVEDLSREVLRAQFEVNLFGTHELTTRVVPVMRRAGGGRIIQISSILGLVSLPFRGAYNASKHALEALSDTLRLELRGSGIFVSLIEPGPIESRFRQNAMRRFEDHIRAGESPHRQRYEAVRARLHSDRPDPFTLPPEAVLRKTLLAMERRNPRPRYLVTVPAHALARLKRVLPDRLFDALVRGLSR